MLETFLRFSNYASTRSPIMAKRKLETEEQKLPARDQPPKAKKHKKKHEALPVVDNPVTDRVATSAANGSIENAEAEREESLSEGEIIEPVEGLKKAVTEEEQRRNGTSDHNGQMREEHILQDSVSISQTKRQRKRKRKEKSRGENVVGKEDDQAQGDVVVAKSASRSTEGQDKRKHKHKDKDRRRQKRKVRQDEMKDVLGKKKDQSAWRFSEPVGGHLGDLDPVFSHDEK